MRRAPRRGLLAVTEYPPHHRSAQYEVWGDPIDHSRSPQLHRAAYAQLGLDWDYGRRRVSATTFTHTWAGRDERLRGLSVTMPLKSLAYQTAHIRDRRAEVTGAVNTLQLNANVINGFNTDVGGLVRAFADLGITRLERARIVGAGSTAGSAIAALAELGANHVDVAARRVGAVAALVPIGKRCGVRVIAEPWDATPRQPVPVTISTLPGDAIIGQALGHGLAEAGGILLDVVYGQWPTRLARCWHERGGQAESGLGMLLHQALLQVRIFIGGDPDEALPDEAALLAAMQDALMKD